MEIMKMIYGKHYLKLNELVNRFSNWYLVKRDATGYIITYWTSIHHIKWQEWFVDNND
jgi:hypothetical protein